MSVSTDPLTTSPPARSTAGEARGTRPRVAFQGEPGAFSEEAIFEFFGDRAVPLPCREFRHVGEAVRSGAAEYGLLPIENTLAGAVVGSYDVLADGGLVVIGEVVRPIRHFLLGVPGASIAGLRRVLSHPVALAQCTRFLLAHPGIEAVAVHDTAGAAREVAERGDASVAAIAASGAADRYRLDRIAADLHDRHDNQTRFLVLRRADAPGGGALPDPTSRGPSATGPWKSMLVAEMENRPGALVALLAPFAERSVNLSALECRPGGEPWTYRFFVELEADVTIGGARAALEEAGARAVTLHTLGVFRSYDWRGRSAPA